MQQINKSNENRQRISDQKWFWMSQNWTFLFGSVLLLVSHKLFVGKNKHTSLCFVTMSDLPPEKYGEDVNAAIDSFSVDR